MFADENDYIPSRFEVSCWQIYEEAPEDTNELSRTGKSSYDRSEQAKQHGLDRAHITVRIINLAISPGSATALLSNDTKHSTRAYYHSQGIYRLDSK